MAIQISNVSPVVSETPQSSSSKKKEVDSAAESGQAGGVEVNISGAASFLSSLKSAIDSAGTAGQSKIGEIKQKIASGSYADSSKIAEGIINNLNITGD